ncbi:ankyrin [Thozetella sp. PMI_491]|nr:ankyrin [Thozetella sp. PMI_491]
MGAGQDEHTSHNPVSLVGASSHSSQSVPLWTPVRNDDGDEPVPEYTECQDDGWAEALAALRENSAVLELPILRWPDFPADADGREQYQLASDIITSFYRSIDAQNTEAVAALIHQGLVSPDVTDRHGATPLIAAVQTGHAGVIRALLQLGAEVDGFGTTPEKLQRPARTPLQVAARDGNLVVVKLLREEFGADDAIIAPDGQLALRLAAENKHREVVDYLPVRRGGEFRRWKAHHEVALRRCKLAARKVGFALKCIFWYLPKLIVWWLPKYCIFIPLKKSAKWAWKNRDKFKGWCKRQVVEFPRRVKKAAKSTWDAIKKVPSATRRLLGAIIKALPRAAKAVGLWIWGFLKAFGRALGSVANRTVSFLHTAVTAIATFFRDLTLQDVWNGLRAYKVLDELVGDLGKFLWLLVGALLWLAKYIPEKLAEMVASIGSSVAKGGHEVRVWVNPKA